MINTYRIRTFPGFPTVLLENLPTSRTVTFVAHDGRYSLPNPDLIRLHAAVAHVLDAYSMGHLIEQIMREGEEMGCFSEDGSTDLRVLTIAS